MHKFFSKQISRTARRVIASAATVATCAALFAAPPPPPPAPVPDIFVTGLSMPVEHGSMAPLHYENTYFNRVQLGTTSWDHYFEIHNFGDADLVLNKPVNVSLFNAVDFHVTQQPLGVIAPGQRAMFSIRYVPSTIGEAYGVVSIGSNDPDTGDYLFVVRGDGLAEPMVGPELANTNFHFTKFKCLGVPYYCKVNARVDVQNLSVDTDCNRALVNIYALPGEVVNEHAHLVGQKIIKNLKAYKPGKKLKTKKLKFKGLVPVGYTHMYAEVIPLDGWDTNYTNNTAIFKY